MYKENNVHGNRSQERKAKVEQGNSGGQTMYRQAWGVALQDMQQHFKRVFLLICNDLFFCSILSFASLRDRKVHLSIVVPNQPVLQDILPV